MKAVFPLSVILLNLFSTCAPTDNTFLERKQKELSNSINISVTIGLRM